jgi:hypothetical protein
MFIVSTSDSTSTGQWCQSVFTTPFTMARRVLTYNIFLSSTVSTTIYDDFALSAGVYAVTGSDTVVFTNSIAVHSTTVVTSGTRMAAPLTVFWESSDLSLFPSAYAASLASLIGVTSTMPTTTPPSMSSATSTPQPVNPASTGSRGGSLSTGAKAGIGVGATLGFILIATLATLFLLRRRRYPQPLTVPEVSGETSGFKRFVGGKWRAEAEVKEKPIEIDSRNVRVIPGPPVELDATH